MRSSSSSSSATRTTTTTASLSWSCAILVACVALLYSVSDWHASAKNKRILPSQQQQQQRRALLYDDPTTLSFLSDTPSSNDTTPDEDFDGDEKCREYLLNFLNGTTDAQDECAGMYKAYTESDCKDELIDNTLIRTYSLEQDDNNNNATNTTTDDDIVMDDVFEKWDCCQEISSYYTKHCQEDELFDATRLLGIVTVFILCGWAKSLLRVTKWRWIPDAAACVLVGAIVGGIARLIYPANVVRSKLNFNSHLFMQILLPPIIFQAALCIDKRAFRRDLFPILMFAIVGTAFSAIAIALVTYHLSATFGVEGTTALPLLDCLLFGALMSSIDPVATLSILSGVGLSQSDTLYTLVFGESLLNDGVSIVLFDSFLRTMNGVDGADGSDSVISISSTLYHVCFIALGSIFVGLICGATCTIFFWLFRGMHTAVTEVALFFTWALVPYYIADGLELSGIISIMVMAFVLDSYVIGGSAQLQERRQQQQQQQQREGLFEYVTMSRPIPNEDLGHQESSDLRDDEPHPHSYRAPMPHPALECLAVAWSRAFSGHGHLLELSCTHVGFVAEVISSIMETAIFAYLGLFLFNDNTSGSQGKLLTATGIFACVSSRVVMVIGLCMIINVCVFVDLEEKLGQLWACFVGSDSARSRAQLVGLTGGSDNNATTTPMNSIRLNDPAPMIPPSYLTPKTQLILILAGVRGAVSYALVQNIPVYDSVTKHGSHFKGELRAMTSGTIVVILFVFGALTYFSVNPDDAAAAAAAAAQAVVTRRSLVGGDGNNDMSQLLLQEDTQQQQQQEEVLFSNGTDNNAHATSALELDFRGLQQQEQGRRSSSVSEQ